MPRWCNPTTWQRSPEVDARFVQSQPEIEGETRRAGNSIQEIYIAAAPMVFLVEAPYPVALNKKVKGFVQSPLGNYLFSGVHMERKPPRP